MTLIDALVLLTGLWLVGFAAVAVVCLAGGQKDSVLFPVLVHFVFCGVPLLLDEAIGRPSYDLFQGYHAASQDPTTVVLYCLYVALVPGALLFFGRPSRPRGSVRVTLRKTQGPSACRDYARHATLWAMVVSPCVAAIGSPDVAMYATYGGLATEIVGDSNYHSFVAALSMLSVCAAVGVCLISRRVTLRLLACLGPWVFASCWLFGKRMILALLLFGALYALWSRGVLRGVRFVYGLTITTICVAGMSVIYQLAIRQKNPAEFDTYYSNVRIDFGRDASIRQAIFAELGSTDDRILNFRGESLLFDATMFVPRTNWPEKPWPFAVYQTAKAIGLRQPTSIGWAVTTSWLDEAIANFGWCGLLIGPLALALVCRIGDQVHDALTRFVTVCMAVLLMTVQLPAFLPVALMWLVAVCGRILCNGARRIVPRSALACIHLSRPTECERGGRGVATGQHGDQW